MSGDSIKYEQWLDRSFGTQLVAWEALAIADALENVFGYYALQLGADHRSFLEESRIPHRWLARCEVLAHTDAPALESGEHPPLAHLVLDPHHLPFQANQLDLLVLPHTLEQSSNPRQVVREAERVLLPEGRLLIAGLNPWNPKVAWQRLKNQGSASVFKPLTTARLCDWLELLGFEIEYMVMGGGKPVQNNKRGDGLAGVASAVAGKRYGWWWAKGYVVVATKKVVGMRLLAPPWQVKKLNNGLVGQKARQAGASHRRNKQHED